MKAVKGDPILSADGDRIAARWARDVEMAGDLWSVAVLPRFVFSKPSEMTRPLRVRPVLLTVAMRVFRFENPDAEETLRTGEIDRYFSQEHDVGPSAGGVVAALDVVRALPELRGYGYVRDLLERLGEYYAERRDYEETKGRSA